VYATVPWIVSGLKKIANATRNPGQQLELTDAVIFRRIETAKIEARRGKSLTGNIRDIYPVEVVHELCADLLDPNLIVQREDGAFIEGDIEFEMALQLSEELGVSRTKLYSRAEQHGIAARGGFTLKGKLCALYPKRAIREAFADLNDPTVLQLDDERSCRVGDDTYGTSKFIAQQLGFSSKSGVGQFLKNHPLPTLRGKIREGNVVPIYSLKAALAARGLKDSKEE
jgi:hypothetical protein